MKIYYFIILKHQMNDNSDLFFLVVELLGKSLFTE